MKEIFLKEENCRFLVGFLILDFLLLLPLARADTYLTDCAVLDTPGETYYLTQDIINYTASTCMNISADNVILDCQGHLIDGVGDNTGIEIYNSSYVVIRNCVLTDWYFGVDLTSSSNNNLQNLTISSCDGYSIRITLSYFNTLTDITIYNSSFGLIIQSSDYTSIFNSTIMSINYDTTREQMYCHSYFENVTGTGDKPIIFFNSTVEIRDWDNNASEIILCGADNSIIDNLSVINSDQFGLVVTASNNVNVTNSLFESRIILRYSEYNTIRNLTTQLIYLFFSNYNTISDSKIQNSYGIYLSFSNYNTISDSKIQNCTYGISLRNSANNSIYNNLFNISSFYFYLNIYPNYWNTTRQEGARIYSLGNEIGGNYWTNPDGNGYSDTCTDADKDGFCDDPYVLATDNVDYLALSDEYPPPPTTTTLPRLSESSPISALIVVVVLCVAPALWFMREFLTSTELSPVEKLIRVILVMLALIASMILLAQFFSII